MSTLDGRRYGIAEVSEMTDVPTHVLRQWEGRFPQLRPKRDRANHRYYTDGDVAMVRRIKQLLWNEKMTTEGARKRLAQKRLAQELRGEGRPQTRQEALEILDKIETEVRNMLDLLDR
jgi:DNA-binding transcriptional MerR regulator